MTAASLLERFLFSREQQQVYASQLSGGEKRRLYLLTVLMGNPNFLILDEPTNDLDILTLNVLEDFLENTYKGCCIIVTHDRYFMDRIVDHLFIFEGQGIVRDSNGNYTEYREALKLAQREKRLETTTEKPVAVNNKAGLNDTERKELRKLERDLEKFESRKKEITSQFDNAGNLSAAEITKLSKELHAVEAQLEGVEMRWMELSEK
jgi:ATP-binding cassette subfamily F protein uup